MHTQGELQADLPDGWSWKESHTYTAPGGRANVIASSEQLDSEMDSNAYAETQGRLLVNEFPGYHEHECSPTTAFGVDGGTYRRFEWQPKDGAPVMQAQIYLTVGDRGYTATATATREDYLLMERDLIAVLTSISRRP